MVKWKFILCHIIELELSTLGVKLLDNTLHCPICKVPWVGFELNQKTYRCPSCECLFLMKSSVVASKEPRHTKYGQFSSQVMVRLSFQVLTDKYLSSPVYEPVQTIQSEEALIPVSS